MTDGKREILLSVTPHIVKKVDVPGQNDARIWSGGEDELKAGPNFAAFAEQPEPTEAAPLAAPAKQEAPDAVPAPGAEQPGPKSPEQQVPPSPAGGEPTGEEPPVESMQSEPVQQTLPEAGEAVEPDATPPAAGQPLKPQSPSTSRDEVAKIDLPPADISTPVKKAKLFVSGPKLVNVGDEVTVELQVAEVDALYSAPLFVNYNPALLDFVRAEEGDFLRLPGQSTVFTSSPNRSRGELIIGNKQGAGGDGASGSGVLSRIVFRAKQAGKAVIRPNRINFRDPSGSRLAMNVEQLTIEIE